MDLHSLKLKIRGWDGVKNNIWHLDTKNDYSFMNILYKIWVKQL